MWRMAYPGGKAGSGVYQTLINQIPPHDVFVSAFAGHCAVLRRKRPARRNIAIDLDEDPLRHLAAECGEMAGLELYRCDAIAWLRVTFGLDLIAGSRSRARESPDSEAAPGAGAGTRVSPPATSAERPRPTDSAASPAAAPAAGGWFVFCDPPYPMSTRTSGRIYRCDQTDDAFHDRLLAMLAALPCRVLVCSYPNALYRDALRGWRTLTYFATVRSGERRREQLWANYDAPSALHDYRFLGHDKREREKIARRRRNLEAKLQRLPEIERTALLEHVRNLAGASGS